MSLTLVEVSFLDASPRLPLTSLLALYFFSRFVAANATGDQQTFDVVVGDPSIPQIGYCRFVPSFPVPFVPLLPTLPPSLTADKDSELSNLTVNDSVPWFSLSTLRRKGLTAWMLSRRLPSRRFLDRLLCQSQKVGLDLGKPSRDKPLILCSFVQQPKSTRSKLVPTESVRPSFFVSFSPSS